MLHDNVVRLVRTGVKINNLNEYNLVNRPKTSFTNFVCRIKVTGCSLDLSQGEISCLQFESLKIYKKDR